MEKEDIRLSLNRFLKMYFNACNEVYSEINFDRITKIQFKYLKAIKELQPTTLTDLADKFDVAKPSMNEVIGKFYESGLIKKKKAVDDRRITYISLTEMGTTLATTNLLESNRAVDKILQNLNNDEIELLVSLFNKFGEKTL